MSSLATNANEPVAVGGIGFECLLRFKLSARLFFPPWLFGITLDKDIELSCRVSLVKSRAGLMVIELVEGPGKLDEVASSDGLSSGSKAGGVVIPPFLCLSPGMYWAKLSHRKRGDSPRSVSTVGAAKSSNVSRSGRKGIHLPHRHLQDLLHNHLCDPIRSDPELHR